MLLVRVNRLGSLDSLEKSWTTFCVVHNHHDCHSTNVAHFELRIEISYVLLAESGIGINLFLGAKLQSLKTGKLTFLLIFCDSHSFMKMHSIHCSAQDGIVVDDVQD